MLKFTLKLKFIIWDQVYFADRREKVDCKTTESAVARTVVTADHEDVDDDKEAGQLSKLVLVRVIIKIILMVVIMILIMMAMLMIMMIIIMIMMIMKVSEMTMTMTRRLADRIGVKHLMWFT